VLCSGANRGYGQQYGRLRWHNGTSLFAELYLIVDSALIDGLDAVFYPQNPSDNGLMTRHWVSPDPNAKKLFKEKQNT
jgi:hypothetical protein